MVSIRFYCKDCKECKKYKYICNEKAVEHYCGESEEFLNISNIRSIWDSICEDAVFE